MTVEKNIRYTWVDFARGAAVILVAVQHTIPFITEYFNFQTTRQTDALIDFLMMMRMPALCMISGLFVSRTNKYVGKSFWTQRVLYFVHLYVFWSVFYIVFNFCLSIVSGKSGIDGAKPWVLKTIYADAFLWYFLALAFFYIFYRFTRKIPKPLILVVLIGLTLIWGSDIVVTKSWGLDHILQYLIYFMLGAWGGPKLVERLDRVTAREYFIISAVLVALDAIVMVIWTTSVRNWAQAVLGPLALLWFLATCVLLNRTTKFSNMMQRVGRHTLSIYALHWAVIRILFFILSKFTVLSLMSEQLIPVLALAIGLVATFICLLAWKKTNEMIPWAYSCPEMLKAKRQIKVS